MVIAEDFGVPACMSLWSLDVFFLRERTRGDKIKVDKGWMNCVNCDRKGEKIGCVHTRESGEKMEKDWSIAKR
jgi:hypothetical protein